MEIRMKKYLALWLPLILFSFMLMNCSTLKLESTWKERDIVLDGKGGDWLGAKYYFEEYAMSIGLINDEQFLYVSMMTENPMIRAQIMRNGLTVWFDRRGGKNRSFGIKFPLEMPKKEKEEERIDPQEMMDETSRKEMMQKFQETMTELEILGQDEKVLAKMNIEDAKGIKVKARDAMGTFVYELEVPLGSSEEYPYAVDVKAGDVIGVGFLSPKLEFRRPSGERGGGRVPGGGMGGPGEMGAMPRMGGMGRFMPQELKIWARVQLASHSQPALSFF